MNMAMLMALLLMMISGLYTYLKTHQAIYNIYKYLNTYHFLHVNHTSKKWFRNKIKYLEMLFSPKRFADLCLRALILQPQYSSKSFGILF